MKFWKKIEESHQMALFLVKLTHSVVWKDKIVLKSFTVGT